ncbi:MAG: sulfatase [Verrucomicrobiota bacterium]
MNQRITPLIYLFSALVAVLLQPSQTQAAPEKPNFIVILTDDLGYGDFACYGATGIQTPEIDRMAEEGTKFESFYVASVCSPTRASFMTGNYPLRAGIGGVLFPRNDLGLKPEEITLPELLKQQGYATAIVGKWHLGFQPHQLPLNHGFDHWYGTLSSNSSPLAPDQQFYEFAPDCSFRDGFSRELIGKKTLACPLIRNNQIIEAPADQTLFTKRYTEETIRLISENKDQPFFIYLAHNMPHIPLYVSEKFQGSSEHGLYGDVIQELDWSVGEVLKALKEQGLDETTFVILTSDNGPKKSVGGRSGSLKGEKGATFEGGQRVPCIVRWPGKVPAGIVNKEPVAIFDLLPTLVQLAGGSVPTERVIDGKDIWPAIAGAGKVETPHEAYFYLRGLSVKGVRVDQWKLHYSDPPKDKSKPQVTLTKEERQLPRDERQKLIRERSRALNPKKGPVLSLYNLEKDIGEERNVIDEHPEIAQRLKAKMEAFRLEMVESKRPAGIPNP